MVRNHSTGRFQRTNSKAAGRRQSQPATGGGMGPAIGIIAGAGIGAALMFLLDPEKGKRRRRYLTDAAGRAVETTGHAVGNAWEVVGEKAGAAGAALADVLPSREDIRRAGEHLLHRADDATTPLRDAGQSMFDSARSRAESYLPQHRPSRRFSPTTATAAGVTAAGVVTLGLGAVWLFHPTSGRERRARIGSAINRFAQDTCDMACAAGRSIKEKASAYSKQAISLIRRDDECEDSDINLIDSVRAEIAELGLIGSSVAIDLQDESLILAGRCRAEDVGRILSAARDVIGGDRRITNRLDVSEGVETETAER